MHRLQNMLGPWRCNWIQTHQDRCLHGQGLKPIHPVSDAHAAAGVIVRVQIVPGRPSRPPFGHQRCVGVKHSKILLITDFRNNFFGRTGFLQQLAGLIRVAGHDHGIVMIFKGLSCAGVSLHAADSDPGIAAH